jgi:hypothetical protein
MERGRLTLQVCDHSNSKLNLANTDPSTKSSPG